MTFDFRDGNVVALATQVRAGEVSARELVAHTMARIDATEPTINAFTAVDGERAMARAAAIDEAIAAGQDVGPLAGLPLAVKDLEDADGFITGLSSATHATDPPAARNSVVVQRLVDAGCIVVGKTNSPEFGLKPQTDNPTNGITRNPWNPARTPGGSSGGTSAALAAGVVPLATGSDGGGSIRIPSAACGLSGLKPSLGRIPAADPGPPGWTHLATRGVMARHIADVAAALDVVRGPDRRDLRSLPHDGRSWADAVTRDWRPRRVAWCPTLGYADVDSEIAGVCEAAVRLLEKEGVDVVTVDRVFDEDPGVAIAAQVSAYTWRNVEPYRNTEYWSRLDPLVVVSAEMARLTGSVLGLVAAEDACHRLNRQLNDVLDDYDVLLCPTTCGQLPDADMPTTVDAMLAALGGSGAIDIAGLDMEGLGELLAYVQDREPINFPMGTIDGERVLDWSRLTQPFNLTQVPAGTVNAGFTADGLPIGLQVVGPQHGDEAVLSAVSWFETALAIDAVAPI
jgi:Asp-tRNA(Asn)/Glu-tRNA(Gln) amidotransferase A subunit family amidase